MRNNFDKQLDHLNKNLLEMAEMVKQSILLASEAVKTQDAELSKQIIENDDEIDDKEKNIEALCLKLLLHQQPVARDLRQVSTALKMITDLERIGDHASDISEITEYLIGRTYINKIEYISKMTEATIYMVEKAIEAYVLKDLEMAENVIKYDDVVDELFLETKRYLIDLIHVDHECGEEAIDLMMVAKYLERIGDHAVNIAEWVVFSITGVHRNKQIL